jgi:hypothetical protein
LARPLLMWVLALTAVSGCFWPQDDSVFSPIPDKRNSPPRIIPSTIQPADIDVSYGPNCILPFSVNVEDPDVADLIRVKWFVYPPGGKPLISIDGKTILGGSTAVRAKAVTAEDAPTLKSAASELIQNGEHRLEVFIADNEFEATTTAGAISTTPRNRSLPDGGSVDDPSYFDSHVWIVKTSSTLACP